MVKICQAILVLIKAYQASQQYKILCKQQKLFKGNNRQGKREQTIVLK